MGKSDGKARLKAWSKIAERQGWTVRPGGRHLHWFGPDGSLRASTPLTPCAGWRTMLNTRATLRRAGLEGIE